MAQPVNGVLYVDYFTATENPGEYTFENAVFNTQVDPDGLGASLITTDFVLFVPAMDPNIVTLIPGSLSRYRFTEITAIDATMASGKIIFDEDGVEFGVPGTGVFCLVAKTSPNLKIAFPPLDAIYSDLMIGGTISAMINDLVNIVDKAGSGSSGVPPSPERLLVTVNGQIQFPITRTLQYPGSVLVSLNGQIVYQGVDKDYTINDNVLTWNGIDLLMDDNLVLH